jgi:hypothetical protein
MNTKERLKKEWDDSKLFILIVFIFLGGIMKFAYVE